MAGTTLHQAIETFSAAALGVSDAGMEQKSPWQGRDTDVRWQLFLTYQDLRTLDSEIAVERSRQGPPLTTAQAALVQYQVACRDLHGLLLGVRDDELDRAPAEGEWPLRRILVHAMQVESSFLIITNYALERQRSGDDRPVAMPMDEFQRLRQEAPSAEGSLREVLARYDTLHERVLHDLASVPEEALSAPVGFWFEADVRFHLYRFDAHLREHTIQIEKALEAIRPRPNDAHRTLRLIYQALGEAEGAVLGAPDFLSARREEIAACIAERANVVRREA